MNYKNILIFCGILALIIWLGVWLSNLPETPEYQKFKECRINCLKEENKNTYDWCRAKCCFEYPLCLKDW